MDLKSYKILIVVFLSIFQSGIAQINFTTSVSKNKLGVNQRFRIEFTIDKQGADDFTPPSFSHFRVVGGPSSSVSQSWINGKSSYTQSYIYVLQPKEVGVFTIQPATIVYKGKKVKSNPVKMTVTKEVAVPKDPNNPQYVAQQGIHLVTQINNSSPYIGEAIYVEYKLYVAPNISIFDYSIIESPQYVGFWGKDIEINSLRGKQEMYKGQKCTAITFKKAVLVPQKGGKLIIPKMKIDFSVGIPTGRGDFFGNMITRNTVYSAKSPIREIRVKSLPTQGKPEDFSGAVGDFNFTVKATNDVKKANDASQIKVEISGKGNLKLIEIPKLVAPKELEIYTPEHKENLQTSIRGSKGSISDVYTVVPQYKGKYKIPAVSFSYFNPKERKYKTITSKEIILDVQEGKEMPTVADTEVSEKKVAVSDTDFKYIGLHTDFSSQKDSFFNSWAYYLWLLLPLLVIPIVILVYRKKRADALDVAGNKRRKADKLAKKYLSEAKKKLGQKEAFYIALEKALHNYLKAKLQVETADISKEKIQALLEERQVKSTTIKAFLEVLQDCEFARYTPISDVEMAKEYEKAKTIISEMDRVF